jgi:hypothetical protein
VFHMVRIGRQGKLNPGTRRPRRHRLAPGLSIERLEDRLPPGDTLIGALLGWSWLGEPLAAAELAPPAPPAAFEASPPAQRRPLTATDVRTWPRRTPTRTVCRF